MSIPFPEKCCTYNIREETADEYLSVAPVPPPYIIRWTGTGDSGQRWIVVPEDANTCRIVNCANGEFMAIGDDGFLVRWTHRNEPAQQFRFVNHDAGWWNIQSSDGKYVTVVLPWGPGVARLNTQPLLRNESDKKYQRFRLVPVDEKQPPAVEKGQYAPGAIPEIPRLQHFGQHPPERSDAYLIGETVLPATLVDDPGLPDIVVRVQRNPYYILRRQQYWDRTQCTGGDPCLYEHDGHMRKRYETEITYGYSQTQAQTMARTVGMKVSAEGKVVFNPTVSSSLSTTIQNNLQIQESTATEYKESIRETATLYVPAERFIVCNWVLVNQYTLLNMQREEIGRWNAIQYGVLVSDGYPKPLELNTLPPSQSGEELQ